MTRVKILTTFRIAPDGINVQTWPAGSERDVDDATLELLIGEGACEIMNKSMPGPTENKRRKR